jgi:retron-type reverse transcriptase
VNDNIGHYLQTQKGLGQGDPLSPILFNLFCDMLAILIPRAKEHGQIEDLIPHIVEGVSYFKICKPRDYFYGA